MTVTYAFQISKLGSSPFLVMNDVVEFANMKFAVIAITGHATGLIGIIELWKAGDFFGIAEVCDTARHTMFKRLQHSSIFFAYDPKAKDKPQAKEPPTRDMIENEVKEICDALVFVMAETPKDCRMQGEMLKHVCNKPFVRDAISRSTYFASFMKECPRGLMETLTLRLMGETRIFGTDWDQWE